jgi:hypothetical protein
MNRAAGLALCLLVPGLAFTLDATAARPFVTDDARVVDAGGCQIESFAKRDRANDRSELWFLPACNPGGRVEFTLGGRRIDERDETGRAAIVQAKALLKRLETNGTGFAFTVGALRDRPGPDDAVSDWSGFINAIASSSFHDDLVVLHANLGALKDPATRRLPHTWGLGAELALTRHLYGIVEGYGQQGEPTSRQLGVRYWVVRDRFQVDGTSGRQRGASWVSLGLRLLF